jgi:hypothetical protein
MLITTSMREHDVLVFDCYTFSNDEWNALGSTLLAAGARTDFSPLGRDRAGREGRRYFIEGLTPIQTLASFLRGRFDPNGRFESEPNAPKVYACREVTRTGIGTGCQEFASSDLSSAIVKCGIIAGQKSWLGGDAKEGKCRRRGF